MKNEGIKIRTGQVWVFKSCPSLVILSTPRDFVVAMAERGLNRHPFCYKKTDFINTFVNTMAGNCLLEATYMGTKIVWDNDADLWSIHGTAEFDYLEDAEAFVDKKNEQI